MIFAIFGSLFLRRLERVYSFDATSKDLTLCLRSTSCVVLSKLTVFFLGQFLHLHVFEAVRGPVIVLDDRVTDAVGRVSS